MKNKEGMDRRDFLKTATAVGSGALLASCTPKEDSRFVSVVQYEDADHPPGAPWFFNSTCTECPANCGIEVKSYDKYDGREKKKYPVKLEGLNGHPVNGADKDRRGNLCMRGQGALTRLYAPEKDSNLMSFSLPKEKALLNFSARVQTPKAKDKEGKWKEITWEDAYARIRNALKAEGQDTRKNIWLSGRTTGTLQGMVGGFCSSMGVEKHPDYEVYSHAAVRKANEILFGIADVPQMKIGESDFLLSLGADILETHISPVSFTKQLSERRKTEGFSWFHLEPHLSLTGMRARKQRLVIRPGSEPYLLAWLLNQYENKKNANRKTLTKPVADPGLKLVCQRTGLSVEQVEAIKGQLNSARKPLLIVGGVSTAHETGLETALLAGLLQWVTGMTENVVDFTHSENYEGVGSLAWMQALSESLAAGKVGVLFTGWTDPVKTVPSSIGLKKNLGKARLHVAMTDFMNDTAKESDLILPLAHSLESSGDAEPRRGVWSRIRPVMAPLGNTRSAGDIFLGYQVFDAGETEYEKVKSSEIKKGTSEADSAKEAAKNRTLAVKEAREKLGSYQDHLTREWNRRFKGKNGADWDWYIDETVGVRKLQLGEKYAGHLKAVGDLPVLSENSIVVVPSLRTFDGRSSALRLMEEIPDPLSTVSYGEWCAVSEKVAEREQLEDRDWVNLNLKDASQKMPVKIQPGLPDGIVMVQRDMMPDLPFKISEKTGEMSVYAEPVKVKKSGGKQKGNHMVVLSGSMSQDGRGIIRTKNEKRHKHHDNGLYPSVYSEGKILGHPHEEYDWGMTVDLDSCTGCSACVAACYTENNIPMVGSWDHWKGREMSWLRIEPYKPSKDDPVPQFIPMMCQHCHDAPCEPVCPVYATMHTEDGLNAQVYNRCVGTRYCSNNCPYKVRRFNWWSHDEDKWEGNLKWLQNPEISIRTKGIMEKCTFCVQRIRKGRDQAKDEKRLVKDGDVTPACAQTCPTGAITFGNMRDETSKVSKLSKNDRSYQVFEELGTTPSVYYLR